VSDPSNSDRAQWALNAVKVFATETGLDWTETEDLECAIQDLMTNLMHLADSESLDAERLKDVAVSIYHEEVEEEEDE